jgi:hypothetical protein
MNNPMNDLWRAQQDAATRFTDSWRELLQPATERAPQTPTPPAEDDRTPEPGDTDPEDATDSDTTHEITGPEPGSLQASEAIQAIQNLSDGQRDFAEHITRWAELQRDLADSMTAWASQQREYADALDRLLAPLSPPA